MAVSASIRTRLAAFAQSKRTRLVEFTRRSPSRWQPRQFTDPRSGQAFTDQSAWEYIVDHLQSGIPIEEKRLEKPPGAKGYVIHLPGANKRKIYVKLQICGDHVKGRSFHESELG
ncbi:MAG TPA: hypothetical protein VIY51_01240 [Xanthobacteraceae bacterium]